MRENYAYPLDTDWSHEEIALVINLYQLVEQAYESRVRVEDLNIAYQGFKQVVKSKSEEKQLGKAFEDVSGYSIYQTIQRAKQAGDWLTMTRRIEKKGRR